jgi:hypothetical protein
MERAVVQVIKNCTFGKLDVDILPTFDIEYLFLQLRAKSVNNVLDLRYECRNTLRDKSQRTSETDDGRCHNTVTLKVNLNDIEITTDEAHTPTVTLQSGLLVEMAYPSMKVVQSIQKVDQTGEQVTKMLIAAMKTITDAEGTTYEVQDYTDAERLEFVDGLPVEDLRSFEAFFTTMPAVRSEVPFHCDKCEHDETVTLQGLTAFFT